MSNSSGSRSVSPKTPVGRPGAGRSDDYFAPKIASEYDSTPPQQPRRPGGYGGGFSDPDGYGMDAMYPATSPKKQVPDLMSRMNSLAPGPFEASRRAAGARQPPASRAGAGPRVGAGPGADMNSSDDDYPSRGRYANDRPSTSASMRSNGSNGGAGGVAPPRLTRKDGYGGFGPRQRQDDFEPEPFGTSSRAGTFPRQSEAVDIPLRTPSAPGPRPDRLRRPSNALPPLPADMLPPRTPRSRRPSMGPDTSRPPPPRTSLVRPRTSGRDTPSINLAAEFGIGNPYHATSESTSSSASTYSRPSLASSQSSPERSMGSMGSMGSRLGRKPSNANFDSLRQPSNANVDSFDNLMSDLQSLSQTKPPPPPPATDKPTSLRNRRQPGPSDSRNGLPDSRNGPPAQEEARSRSRNGPSAQDEARSRGRNGPSTQEEARSRSRSRPPLREPAWDSVRRNEPPMPDAFREFSPKAPTDAERRARSRSRGRDPNGVPSRGICKACRDPISGKSISSADGQLTGRYHKACFVCTTCAKPFSTSTFYVFDDKPYCEHHYHEVNGSLCGSCGDGIEGQYLADEADKKYHSECFICTDCGDVLRDGYFEVGGKPYCEKDAWKRTQQPWMAAPKPASRSNSTMSTMSSNGSAFGGAPRGLPSTPNGGFGLPARPGGGAGPFGGFGLPSGNRIGLPGSRPKMEKRMTRIGVM